MMSPGCGGGLCRCRLHRVTGVGCCELRRGARVPRARARAAEDRRPRSSRSAAARRIPAGSCRRRRQLPRPREPEPRQRNDRRERIGAAMVEHFLILGRARPRRRAARGRPRPRRNVGTSPATVPNSVGAAASRAAIASAGRATPEGNCRSTGRDEHGARRASTPDTAAGRATPARALPAPSPTRPSATAARNRGIVPGLSAALAVRATIVADALGGAPRVAVERFGQREVRPVARRRAAQAARRRHVGRLPVELGRLAQPAVRSGDLRLR